MIRFLKAFGTRFAAGRRHSTPRRPKARSRVRLDLETLEDRLVPTVSFTPRFGGEGYSYNSGPGTTCLIGPVIEPIFWGSWWQNNQAAETSLWVALSEIAGGAYLNGINQYCNNDAYVSNVGIPVMDASSSPPNNQVFTNFPWGDPVMDEAHKLMNNGTVPNPGQTKPYPPIYVVITDPNVTDPKDNAFGFNEAGSLNYDHWIIWVSAGRSGVFNQDFATRIFSHELVEVMTNPWAGSRVSAGPSFPANTSAGAPGGQIADNEPNNNYVYRFGGPAGEIVQAFWSDDAFDKDYIIEDGNSLEMQIDTSQAWSGSPLRFSGGKLVIYGDQSKFGIPIPSQYVGNQVISVGTVQMPGGPGVEVVMDGEKFDFETGEIGSIQVNAANDNETIAVAGTLSGVPVNITLGSGTYQVNLSGNQSAVTVTAGSGSYQVSLLGGIQSAVTVLSSQGGIGGVAISGSIQAPVNISNAGGGSLDVQLAPTAGLSQIAALIGVLGGSNTSIEVNDGGNPNNTTYRLGNAPVGQLKVPTDPSFGLRYTGITTFSLSGGSGNDVYDLTGWQPGLYERQVNLTTGVLPLTGGGANTILAPPGSATWYLITPSGGYALFNGAQDLGCQWARAKSITIDGGGPLASDVSGGNTFYVEATGVPTYLNTGSGNDTVYVGGTGNIDTNINPNPSLDALDPIQAALTVNGQGGTNTLNVEDNAAATPAGYTLSATTVARSGTATITYGAIQTLKLQAGNHGNSFDVQSTHAGTSETISTGTGTNTANVGGSGQNLDGIRGPLTFADQGTDSLNFNDQQSLGGHTYAVTWTSLSRAKAALITFNLNQATAYINGGGGTNTLGGAGALTTWTITATNAGSWGGKIQFMAMQNLKATTIANKFHFVGSAANITGSLIGSPNGLNGNGGTLDYSANGGLPISVNLQTHKASAIGGTVSAISELVGSTAATNTLYAANTLNNWSIDAANFGTINGLNGFIFSGIENLVGGTGVDIFKMFAGGSVSSIDGGSAPSGQGNWLDYSPLSTAVTVNLLNGSATNVGVPSGAAGSVKNIQDVLGGSGSNFLTGNARGNILIGGQGTITGGTGRSLLIGHSGQNQITGGSGASANGGDILISGSTAYDIDTNANLFALMSILAEWQSTIDSYDTRFHDINQGTSYGLGGHLNGNNTLNLGTTVFPDFVPNTLTGATSQQGQTPLVDWFFASPLDTLFGYEIGEHRNNT